MLAYQLFGENKEPSKKSDHFVGDFYVKYDMYAKEHEAAESQIQEMLQLREQ